MSAGYVVEHKESGIRYATSAHNFDKAKERKIRDLKPHETVRGYKPRYVNNREEEAAAASPPEQHASLETATPKKG